KKLLVAPSARKYTGVAVTVRVKVEVVVLVPSEADTVICVLPEAPNTGDAVKVRLAPLPPSVMSAFGSSALFDEVALTTSASTAVTSSPTVKLIGPSTPPPAIV